MIGRWLARRRFQRECPHPREAERSWLVNTGANKIFECGRCGRRQFI